MKQEYAIKINIMMSKMAFGLLFSEIMKRSYQGRFLAAYEVLLIFFMNVLNLSLEVDFLL